MKKLTIVIAFAGMFSHGIHAQGVEQGKVLLDAYYGVPNLYESILKTAVANGPNALNVKVGGLGGAIGLKGEYMLTNVFGMGLDFNYSTFYVSFNQATTNQLGLPVVYNYKWTSPAIRAMLGFNFHFVHKEKVDVYAAVKTGYYNRTFAFTTNDPSYTGASIKSLIPIAFRLETGMRYYFTEHLGVHINIGIGGGPILAAGLSTKF